MKRILAWVCPLALSAALQAQQTPPSKTESPAPNALQSLERFNNREMTMSFLRSGKQTAPAAAHITIRDWQIHGKQKTEKFPESGFLVVELLSGKVTTIINGKEEKHNPGEFWTVPAGASMSVQVTTESAAFHVLAIGKP
jgi:glyoxylate utilization-related uncharacterized protein